MKKNIKKIGAGFTIIELIVVIAIIAVLAAIVLVNVTQYIAKGKDAAVKGNMASMVTIAASFYDNHQSSYAELESDAAYSAGLTAIADADGTAEAVVHEIATGTTDAPAVVADKAFCVQTTLNDGGTWCVDSTGYKGTADGCDLVRASCAVEL